jgi:hypothetical protein
MDGTECTLYSQACWNMVPHHIHFHHRTNSICITAECSQTSGNGSITWVSYIQGVPEGICQTSGGCSIC